MAFWGGVILAILIASLQHLCPIKIPWQLEPRTFLAFAFYMSGYMYKKYGFNQHKPLSFEWLLWMMVPAVTSCFIKMDMLTVHSLSWFYYIVAICGTIGFIQFAKKLQYGKVVALFNYIGNKTLYILTFHLLAFKIVSYIVIRMEGRPITDLSILLPASMNPAEWMWVLYTIVGVAVPLAIWELFHLKIWVKKEAIK